MGRVKINKKIIYGGAIIALGIVVVLINVIPDKPPTIVNWILLIIGICILTYLGVKDEDNERERVLKGIRSNKKD